MSDPNEWPDEAREAAYRAVVQANPETSSATEVADDVLAALAPFLAARVAAARREGMREAQDAVRRIRDPGFPDDNATDKAIRGHYNAGVVGAVQAIAAILARAEGKP
jgi:hypothetical protein